MQCPECGERMTGSYDGGEANDYQLCVPACNYCGYVDWDADYDDEEDEPLRSEDAEDRYRLRFG